MEMNRGRLLREKKAINTIWANDGFDRARGRCKRSAERILCIRGELRKGRNGDPRADYQVTRDRAADARLDAKVSVRIDTWFRDGLVHGAREYHLTRQRYAAGRVDGKLASGYLI